MYGNRCQRFLSSCSPLFCKTSFQRSSISFCIQKLSVKPVICVGSAQDADMQMANAEPEADIHPEIEDKALQQMKDRIAKESAKGIATRNQQALWDKVLEMRILLQRSLTSSQQLPRLQELQVVKATSPSCSDMLDALSKASPLTVSANSLANAEWVI